MWAALSRIILRYRLPILIVITVMTVFMGWMATKAEMTYALAQILPQDDPEYQAYTSFKERFGEDANILVIGIESENLFQKELFNAWKEAGDSIKALPEVRGLLSLSGIYNLQRDDSLQKFQIDPVIKQAPKTQQELDSLKNVILSLPFYQDLLLTKTAEGKYATVMLVTMDQKSIDTKGRKELIEHLTSYTDKFSQKQNLEVHYSGLPYIRTMNSEKLKKELGMFLWMSLLVTALVLLLFFRSFKAIIFPLLVVAISVVWCVGTMVLLGYKITILTALIPPLIVIIGIPNCIFLTNNFHREYKGHGNKIKAISRVVQRIGNATFLTNFNTALGFITFAFVQSQMLREFGILSSINVMQVFILSVTILPIAYTYIPSPKPKQTKHLDNRWMDGIIEWIIKLVTTRRKLIYLLALALVAVSAWGMTKIHTTGNFTDDIPRKDKLITDLKFFEKNFHGVMPFEITIDTKKKNGVMKLSVFRKIDQLQKELRTYPEFSKPLSIAEVIKFAKQGFYGGDSSFYSLPTNEEIAFLLPYAQNMDLKKGGVTRSFLDSTRQFTRVSVQMADIGTKEMERIRSEVRPKIDSIFNPEKFDVKLTGTSIVFLKGTDYLVNNLLMSLLAAIVLISGLMYFMFYSFKMLMISAIPNVIPLLFTAGLMGFYGIALKSSTILVFNIAYGITVDSAIHFFSRYGQDLKANNFDIRLAVIATIRDTSISIIYTSIILLFGFSIFIFSSFGGTIALGFLISVTIFVGLFTNLLLLPTLLLSIDRAFMIKAYKEPLIAVFNEEEDIDLDSLTIRKEPFNHPTED
ncbi:MAG TPA: efflux RND transporter permease subunit [Flavobacteriales bacterium]|nr:efflux RND transporter permease subunit [Flavobacteriales bacterium]